MNGVGGEDLDQALSDWTANKNAHQLMQVLQSKQIPAAATHKASTLINDVHLAKRGYWQWMERAVVGNQPNPSSPFRANGHALELTSPAPTLGQHNHEVLVGELGVSEGEYERLMKAGIIGNRPRMPGG